MSAGRYFGTAVLDSSAATTLTTVIDRGGWQLSVRLPWRAEPTNNHPVVQHRLAPYVDALAALLFVATLIVAFLFRTRRRQLPQAPPAAGPAEVPAPALDRS